MSNDFGPIHYRSDTNEVVISHARFSALINQAEENKKLKREVKYLRQYGNKDCTAMADDALAMAAAVEECPDCLKPRIACRCIEPELAENPTTELLRFMDEHGAKRVPLDEIEPLPERES